MNCSMENCDRPARQKGGLCVNHERRNRLYGSPDGGRFQFPAGTPLAERLRLRSLPAEGEGGCRLWTGGRGGANNAYGVVGRPEGGQVTAHTAAWEVAHGSPVPKGKVVRHTCDVPLCINPDHLVIGSQGDNMQDKVDRNRQLKGTQIHGARLTPDDVRNIRTRIKAGDTYSGIARDYGVWPTTIHDIGAGKTWKSVS